MAKKFSTARKAEYLILISKLLKNGFSLSDAINCLRLLESEPEVFDLIYQDLRKGKMISESLIHFNLPTVVYNQLIIAQDHGKLAQALEQTGLLLQNQAKQKNKFKELLAYPCFILMFLVTMLVGMKVFIVPQLAIDGGSQTIDLFLGIILLILVLTALGVLFLIFFIRKKEEYYRALFLIKLPLVGRIYLSFFHFLILQGLGMQLANGMNLYSICENNNRFQKNSIQGYLSIKFIKSLIKGNNLLSLIDQEPLLPKQLQIILQAGESGTALAQDILLMSELKFEETQRNLKKLLGLVQPILFAVIAIIIVVTYLIVLLPIYGMMKGIS